MLCNKITMVNCNKYSCFSAFGPYFLFLVKFIHWFPSKETKENWAKINKFNSFTLNWWALALPFCCCWDFSTRGGEEKCLCWRCSGFYYRFWSWWLVETTLLNEIHFDIMKIFMYIKLSSNIRVEKRMWRKILQALLWFKL